MSAKILIVDDSGLARRMTRQILEELSYGVEEAADGATALERYVLSHPDVVILDMVMHGMYGLDVLIKLKELSPQATGHHRDGMISKNPPGNKRAAGAAAIINKPIKKEDLASALAMVLSGGGVGIAGTYRTDALTELINIGYARAAGALSELTGYRINLEVPHVSIHPIDRISALLNGVITSEVASVNQLFKGPISGNALLMLDREAALLLNRLLTNRPEVQTFDEAAREVIIEVGNIVLNACLGVFGNLLHVSVGFSVPTLQIDSVGEVLKKVALDRQELHFALMIHTRFHMRTNDVSGYLVIILGVASLDRLVLELQKWEERQSA